MTELQFMHDTINGDLRIYNIGNLIFKIQANKHLMAKTDKSRFFFVAGIKNNGYDANLSFINPPEQHQKLIENHMIQAEYAFKMNEEKKKKRLEKLIQLFQEQQKLIDTRTSNVNELMHEKEYNQDKLQMDLDHEYLKNVRLTNKLQEGDSDMENQLEISRVQSKQLAELKNEYDIISKDVSHLDLERKALKIKHEVILKNYAEEEIE